MYSRYFVFISPWKRAWYFIWTNTHPLYQRKLCTMFGWHWLLGKNIFSTSSMYVCYVYIISLWKRAWSTLHLKKLKFVHPREPKDVLCRVWLKLALWFWIRSFRQCIFVMTLLSPLGIGRDLLFEQIWIPFTQGYFAPGLLKLAQWFCRRKRKCEKFTTKTTTLSTTMDNR